MQFLKRSRQKGYPYQELKISKSEMLGRFLARHSDLFAGIVILLYMAVFFFFSFY